MPNVGKPSTGCFSCRKMKVKCDETKPSCTRCTRAKRTCPGYPSAFILIDPSQKLRGRNHTSRSPTLIETERSTYDDWPEHNCLLGSPTATRQDWYNRSLKLFFRTHTHELVPSKHTSKRFLDLLEGFCSFRKLESYLVEALKAVSLSNMAHRVPHLKWISDQALFHRCIALNGIQDALKDITEARKDDLLISLWCIEKAELMDSTQHQWQNHTAGISAILNLRGANQIESEIGLQMFQNLNSQLIYRDILLGTQYHSNIETSKDPLQFHTRMLANLCSDYRRILIRVSREPLISLKERALRIDVDLESIMGEGPKPYRLEERLIGDSKLLIHHFHHLVDAFYWAGYYPIRIRALRLAVECSDDIDSLMERIHTQTILTVGIIPALLGEAITDTEDPVNSPASSVGAFLAIHCCSTIINNPDFKNESIRNWAMDMLKHIGIAYGIKQALTFRDYYLSGHVLADGARMIASAAGHFPITAPAFLTGHEHHNMLETIGSSDLSKEST